MKTSIIAIPATVSRSLHRRGLAVSTWLFVWALAAPPEPAFAATYTWSGGNGTWNTTSLNWNTSAIAWPNVASPADNATFTGSNAVTLASVSINVNTITTASAGLSFTGAGAANSTLAFTGTGAKVTYSAGSNTGVSFSNLTIDTGAGLTLQQNGASTPFTFGTGVVVAGTGAVTLDLGTGGPFGAALNLTTSNSSFAGGFIAKGYARTRQLAAITGTTAGAFGSGVALATGDGARLVYASGAQSAVNGVVAGLTASSGGNILLSGSFGTSSRDRFSVTSGAMLTGSTSQLSQVRRVSSFSASPTQAEVILADGATLVASTINVNVDTALSAMNLGTSSNLFFGLGANFNNASFAITIGASTPWQGLSTDGNNGTTGSINRVLSSGTITVNTGGVAFGELLFQSLGMGYDQLPTQLTLGTGTTAPTFVKNGSGDVVARVTPYGRLNLDNASVGAFFASYAVDAEASLYSTRTSALNGKNVSLAAATLGVAGANNQVVTDTVGTVAFSDRSTIVMTTGTGTSGVTLTVADLARSGQAGLAVNAASLSGSQKLYVPSSLQRGKMIVPYLVGNGSGTPEFLFIDSGTGNLGLIRWNTQGVAYDATWAQGNVVLASSGNNNLAIAGTVSADSFQLSSNLTGSGTIQLGVLADGSRAAQAGIITAADNISIAPAINLGTAEFVHWNDRGGTRVTTFNGAVTTSGGLSKNGPGISSLASGSNAITGAIAINQGLLRIAGGNGLGDAATLYVAAAGTFDVSGTSDRVALLTGSGSVALASTRTLTVSGTGSGTFAGVISGAGGLAKGGAGGLTLSGSSTFTGGVQLNGGNLALGSAGALSTSGTISFGGGTLQFTAANTTDYSARFSTAANQAFNFDTNGQAVTFATGLSSTGGSLTKAGAGTLRLNAAGAYAGTTTVSGGTLAAGNAAAFGSGAVAVGSGATLDLGSLAVANAITNNGGVLLNAGNYAGTQTLAGTSLFTSFVGGLLNVASGGVLKGNGTTFSGAVVLQNGATHAPGASPGLQTFTGGLTYDAGSTLQWELIGNTDTGAGTAFDQVLVTGGNLSIATTGLTPLLSLVFNGAGSAVDWTSEFWGINRSWTVVDFSSAGTSTGVFQLEGSPSTWLDAQGVSLATARAGSGGFSVGSSGDDVVLSYTIVVPEPGTAGLACLGIGITAVGLLRRRRPS